MELLYVFGILAVLHTAVGTRCLQCSNATTPLACNLVVGCAPGDQCFLEQYVDVNGQVLYNMGCRSAQQCTYRKRRSSGDIVTCVHCCHDDYCNMDGCGSKPGDLSTRGPKCFSCAESVVPESCRHTKNCDVDEVCGLIHSHDTWRGRCISKVQCSALASISTSHTGCSVCCTGDLCNDRCRNTTAQIGTTAIAPARGVRCLQCANLPRPFDCDIVTTCSHGELCSVEAFVTALGDVRYRTGCMSSQKCSSSKRDSITVCQTCCHGNLCNFEGCGTIVAPKGQRGLKCFSCSAQADPDDCRDVTTCAVHEVCALYENDAARGIWTSDCMQKHQCDAIGNIRTHSSLIGRKRTASGCFQCCDDDFCNANCRNSTHMTPTGSNSTSHIQVRQTTSPSTTITPTTTSAARDKCRLHQGYHYVTHSAMCYKVHYDLRAWDDANNVCKHEGATLAILDTKEKFETLRAKLKHDSQAHNLMVYIGGRHNHHQHSFYWANGNHVTFTAWAPHQPDHNDRDSCIVMDPASTGSHWHAVSCSTLHSYLCMIETH